MRSSDWRGSGEESPPGCLEDLAASSEIYLVIAESRAGEAIALEKEKQQQNVHLKSTCIVCNHHSLLGIVLLHPLQL